MVTLSEMTEQPWLVGLAEEIVDQLPPEERSEFVDAFRRAGWDIERLRVALGKAYVDLLKTRNIKYDNGIAENAYHVAGNTPVENYFRPQPDGMKFWNSLRPRG